jgi:hypothetical protein
MEEKMKKNSLITLSLLLLPQIILATEDVASSHDFLPSIIKKDETLRPYVRSLISGSALPDKVQLFSTIESPASFRQLNFSKLLQGMFGERAWVPHVHTFKNPAIQELLQHYSPKLSATEFEAIFTANVLYSAGTCLYGQTENYTHLEHAASIGHAGAQFAMFSVDFRQGKLEEAKNYLFCSAAQGNSEALCKLSSIYEGFWGIGIPKDMQLAKLVCEEAALLGSPEAIFTLDVATFKEGTFGSKKNFRQSIINATELAKSGNVRSKEFLEGIKMSSADALQEADDDITEQDLDFLRDNLPGWRDTRDDY